MKAIAHAKVKTDSIDSATIYHLLRTDLLPTGYVPPKEIREIKDQLRFRGFVIMLRGMIKNQIHVLVDRNHVLQPGERETQDLFSQAGLTALKEVLLPDRERKILDELLRLYQHLEGQIELGNQWRKCFTAESPSGETLTCAGPLLKL